MEDFGEDHETWLRTFLELPNGIPSHGTFNRVFQMLDPLAFEEAFMGWTNRVREKIPGDVVALDGKALRAACDRGDSPVHMVSAWSCANGMVLGQLAVEEKSNEITAMPQLIRMLHLVHLPEDILFQRSKCETIARIRSETEREGKTVREERFYFSTLPASQAEAVGWSVRSHWTIENRLHWTLDVAFREDGNRSRKGNAAECGAVLRHLVVNLLSRDPNPKGRNIKTGAHQPARPSGPAPAGNPGALARDGTGESRTREDPRGTKYK